MILQSLKFHEIPDRVGLEELIAATGIFLFLFVPNLETEMRSLEDVLLLPHVHRTLVLEHLQQQAMLQFYLSLRRILLLQQRLGVLFIKSKDGFDVCDCFFGGSEGLLVVFLLGN